MVGLTAPAPPAQPGTATATPAFTHLSTGSPRLDALLEGGYPAGSATLLYGPPFTGKQVLQQAAIVAAVTRGVPAALVLHGVSADTMSQRLRRIEPRMADAEAAGLITYVDVHSHFLGDPTTNPNALYVDDPHDLSALARTLATRLGTTPGLLAIQSMSTLLMDLGAAKAFQFLRNVVGRVQRAGGVGLLTLQSGMHTDSEVQMAKHVCGGMVELRKKGDVHGLHLEGLETTVARPGWIEYEATSRGFRLTGSFAARTIH